MTAGNIEREWYAVSDRIRQGHDPDGRDDARRRFHDRLGHLHRVGQHRARGRVAPVASDHLGTHRTHYAARRARVRRACRDVSPSRRAVRLPPRVDGSSHGFSLRVDPFSCHPDGHDRRRRGCVRAFCGRALAVDHSRSLLLVSAGRCLHPRAGLLRSVDGDPDRPHAAAARGTRHGVVPDVGESARRARGEARADDADHREDRCARDSHHPRLHDRPQQHGDRGEFRRGVRGGAVDHGRVRARCRRGDGRLALLERRLEQRHLRRGRGAESAAESCRWRWCSGRGW